MKRDSGESLEGHVEAARMAAKMLIDGQPVRFFVDPTLLLEELIELVGEEKASQLMKTLDESGSVH